MKTIVVRLPEALAANLEREARTRRMTKSDIVRERLEQAPKQKSSTLDAIREFAGCIDDDRLPTDLSARKKHYLKVMGFGRNRHR